MRFLVFAGTLTALFALGFRQVLLLALSLIVSMLISYIVLKPFRDKATEHIAEKTLRRIEKKSGIKAEDETAVEDRIVDQMHDQDRAPDSAERSSDKSD